MSISFPFDKKKSSIFGEIKVPIAKVEFITRKSKKTKVITMIVDSGADYTLLPKFLSEILEIDMNKETYPVVSQGVGGKTTVFILKRKIKIKIGDMTRSILIGFTSNDFIPPLLGRFTFLETFKVVFDDFTTTFS